MNILTAVDVLKVFASIQGNIKNVITDIRNDNEWKKIARSSSKVKIDSQDDVSIEVYSNFL